MHSSSAAIACCRASDPFLMRLTCMHPPLIAYNQVSLAQSLGHKPHPEVLARLAIKKDRCRRLNDYSTLLFTRARFSHKIKRPRVERIADHEYQRSEASHEQKGLPINPRGDLRGATRQRGLGQPVLQRGGRAAECRASNRGACSASTGRQPFPRSCAMGMGGCWIRYADRR